MIINGTSTSFESCQRLFEMFEIVNLLFVTSKLSSKENKMQDKWSSYPRVTYKNFNLCAISECQLGWWSEVIYKCITYFCHSSYRKLLAFIPSNIKVHVNVTIFSKFSAARWIKIRMNVLFPLRFILITPFTSLQLSNNLRGNIVRNAESINLLSISLVSTTISKYC